MAFETDLGNGVWVVENVVTDTDRLREESSLDGYHRSPYAERWTFHVTEEFDHVTVELTRFDKVDSSTLSGRTPEFSDRSLPNDDMLERFAMKIALDTGASYEDMEWVNVDVPWEDEDGEYLPPEEREDGGDDNEN